MAAASALQFLHPHEFLKRFLSYKVRRDGREFDCPRRQIIQKRVLEGVDGSAIFAANNSRYVASVTAEIAPAQVRPLRAGDVRCSVTLPKACGYGRLVQRHISPEAAAAALSQALEAVLHSSGLFDTEQLVIVPEQWSWVLYVSVTCLEFDGCAFDGALAAAAAALEDTVLPGLEWDDEKSWWRRVPKAPLTITLGEDAPLPASKKLPERSFSLKAKPRSVTVTRCCSEYILVDPTALEETYGCSVTFWMAAPSTAIQVLKTDGSGPVVLEEGFVERASRALADLQDQRSSGSSDWMAIYTVNGGSNSSEPSNSRESDKPGHFDAPVEIDDSDDENFM